MTDNKNNNKKEERIGDENTIFEAAYDNDAGLIRVCVVDGGVDPNIKHPRSGHTPLQAAS